MDLSQILVFFDEVFRLMNTTVIIHYHDFHLTITQLLVSFAIFELLLQLYLGGKSDDAD